MFYTRYLFNFILLHLIAAIPRINLYYTDRLSGNDNELQHDCLQSVASLEEANFSRQIISYCMSESSSKFDIEKNDLFPNLTFTELVKRNITVQCQDLDYIRLYINLGVSVVVNKRAA